VTGAATRARKNNYLRDMAEEQAIRLSETDRRIIASLRESGRASAHDISRTLGVDYRVVRRSLTQLIESGTVRISALADPALTGQPVVAFIWLTSRSVENRMGEALGRTPEVMWAAVMRDPTCSTAQVSCASHSALLRLLDDIRGWPDVLDVSAELVLRSYIGPLSASTLPGHSAGDTDGALWLGGETHSLVDETDRQILELLRADGRVALTTIATVVGIPLTTARRRLNRLLDADGVRLQCRVDPVVLGYRFHAGVSIRVAREGAEFAIALSKSPWAAWVSETTGTHAVTVELMATEQAEMDEAVRRIADDRRVRDLRVEYYDHSVKDTGRW
jgi:DNA-binding Lrp family transcriptional regulator